MLPEVRRLQPVCICLLSCWAHPFLRPARRAGSVLLRLRGCTTAPANEYKFVMAVSPLDCMGWWSECHRSAPTTRSQGSSGRSCVDHQQAVSDYCVANTSPRSSVSLLMTLFWAGSQFNQPPLEFSAPQAGCAETLCCLPGSLSCSRERCTLSNATLLRSSILVVPLPSLRTLSI